MHVTRIAELLQPFLSRVPSPGHSELDRRSGEEPTVLSLNQLQRISTYIDILGRWNARINLTAVRDPEEIATRHFGESLFFARYLFPDASASSAAGEVHARVADLGSGAGFPGIPIKLWAPDIRLTLIESNQKKATFLREVCRSLTLTDVDIQNARGEEVSLRYDVVTLRAVENFAEALRIAFRLLAPAGWLALLIGSSQLDLARSSLPDLAWKAPIPIPQSQSRILLLGSLEPILSIGGK
jgi:16S rRNA (guanine527-N7)-methyltransferase